jgi:hypothetical protein
MNKVLLLLLLFVQTLMAQDCAPVPLPYTEDFESALADLIPLCTSKLIISGNSWFTAPQKAGAYSGNVLTYTPCYETASAWFFSKPVYLKAGHTYYIEYLYGNNSPFTVEKFKVTLGIKPTPAFATTTIKKHTVKGACVNLETLSVCISDSGIYYIGIKAESEAYQGELYIDDLTIYE